MKKISRLDHPNLIKVYSYGMIKDYYYIETEQFDGQLLEKELLNQEFLTLEDSLNICLEILNGLELIHQNQIIHSHINPSVIHLEKNGGIKIADYGFRHLSLPFEFLKNTKRNMKKTYYYSPEYLRGEKLDISSDLYSLGILLYKMTTGQVPFKGETIEQISNSHLTEQPLSPSTIQPSLPEELDEIIAQSLAKNPSKRFSSASEMKEAILSLKKSINQTTTLSISLASEIPTNPFALGESMLNDLFSTDRLRSISIKKLLDEEDEIFTNPEMTRPEIRKPETTKPEMTKPEIIKSETAKPRIAKSEITKPEIRKPETTKTQIAKPEKMHNLEKQVLNGRYKLLEFTCMNGVVIVYKGFDTSLDRYVTIKLIDESIEENKDWVRRFIREAKTKAKIYHPHVVQIHDIGQDGKFHYMVIEHVNGPSLAQLIEEKGIFSIEEASQICIQMLEALEQIHQLGIVHRDIKPASILFNGFNSYKLTDFTIAWINSDDPPTQLESEIDSVPYCSPERALGERVSYQSDIYSLGIILYQLVTGQVPFSGDHIHSILLKHIKDPVPSPKRFNPNIPDELEKIILKALEKKTNNRYQSASEMRVALERIR